MTNIAIVLSADVPSRVISLTWVEMFANVLVAIKTVLYEGVHNIRGASDSRF